MNTSRATIPPGREGYLALAFPGPRSGEEPAAFLSFASEGDMGYGVPQSAANRERFLGGLGLEGSKVLGLALAHSRNVLFPERGDDLPAMARALGGADGIVLRDRSLAASVTVADCMPIWILDRESGAFGVLHSGWKGTGILGRALRELAARYGSSPSSVAAILGPAIGSCCYAVPEERARDFAAEFGEPCVRLEEDAQGRPSWRLDLRAANVAVAEAAGLGYLLSVEACTSCDGRLGSYRRQGERSFTRMLAVCGFVSRNAGK